MLIPMLMLIEGEVDADAPSAGSDVCYGCDVVCWDGGVDRMAADEVDEEAMLCVEAVLLVWSLLGVCGRCRYRADSSGLRLRR